MGSYAEKISLIILYFLPPYENMINRVRISMSVWNFIQVFYPAVITKAQLAEQIEDRAYNERRIRTKVVRSQRSAPYGSLPLTVTK